MSIHVPQKTNLIYLVKSNIDPRYEKARITTCKHSYAVQLLFFNGKIKSQCNLVKIAENTFIIGNLLSAPCETNNRIRNIAHRLIYFAANYTIIK